MMTDDTSSVPDMSAYARFFAPLALQAASQGLTYPLVAMVASRGPGGPLNLAGLAQSNTLMYMLGTFGFGLVTAGMVFGRTRKGYRQFQGRHPEHRPAGHIGSRVAVRAPGRASAFRAGDWIAAFHRTSGSDDFVGHCPASVSLFHQNPFPGGHV